CAARGALALAASGGHRALHSFPTRRSSELGPERALYWLRIRTPRERWYDFTTQPGALTLRARPEHLGRLGQPSFVGRRQQHLDRSEEHTSELQSRENLVCRLLLEKKKAQRG